jgi:two-component system sensor histidine kinase KdpD
MRWSVLSLLLGLLAVAAVSALTSALLPQLGLAACALLFLLPVLIAASRGGIAPGVLTAMAGAASYNFFLLEPRMTFRIHEAENLVSAVVLIAVALVISRLATRLRTGEAEALGRARASDEAAALSALLASGNPAVALEKGRGLVEQRYGRLLLLPGGMAADDVGEMNFSSLDLAAAAWARHNGDVTGHGTPIMPAAEWTFLPLAPRERRDEAIAALARPDSGLTRSEDDLAQVKALARLLGQAWDRAELDSERRERERLEDRDRLRRAFLASLAHDFRTPLTVIAGELEELRRTTPAVENALAATRRLDRTMEDLVGAARLEDGSLTPATESIDLIDVVGAACEAVALAGMHPLAIERDVPVDLPFVAADPVLLRHVLVNLIDNAARHARSRIRLVARTTADGAIDLAVEDDGPGVALADRTRIFERFMRAEGSDRVDGSGLGLAIVKGFADAMAMTVTVDTATIGGAAFHLTLPTAGGTMA